MIIFVHSFIVATLNLDELKKHIALGKCIIKNRLVFQESIYIKERRFFLFIIAMHRCSSCFYYYYEINPARSNRYVISSFFLYYLCIV